jgi:hypothetical protein
MEFDLKETLKLVRGGLLDHRATWQEYFDQDPHWQKTVGLLTAPIIVTNVILSLVFARMLGGFYSYGYGSNIFVALILGLISSAIGIALASFVLAFLAGKFQGINSFPRALAAVSLAAIPGAVAGIVAALIPGVGFLLVFAGGILSLVFLYKILPLALGIPEEKRTVHFIVSLVSLFVLNAVVATVLGVGGGAGGGAASSYRSSDKNSDSVAAGSGVFGEIMRQSQLIEAAGEDDYAPPDDEKLSEEQVQAYLKVKQKTRAAQEQYAEKLEALEKEMDNKENPTAADISRVYSGVGGAMSMGNAELEIVKTGGGNWAEHQWVMTSLRNAMLQQGDGSEALAHNYALYEKYREQLEK